VTAAVAALLPPRILGWLDQALAGQKIMHAERLAGGYSNDNILIQAGAGRKFVLRRYARPGICAVEAALAGRLRGVVPVAEVVAADAAAGSPLLRQGRSSDQGPASPGRSRAGGQAGSGGG
jgi:Phosphotransferase enzyme family